MINSIAASLIGSGIVEGGKGTARIVANHLESHEYSSDVGPVLTQFNRELEDKIRNHDDRRVQSIALVWNEIGAELKETELIYGNQEQAVDEIVGTIIQVEGELLEEDLKSELRQIISVLYQDALVEFRQVLKEDEELSRKLNSELNIDIIAKINQLEDELRRVNDTPKRFTLVDSADVNELIKSRLPVSTNSDFVERGELSEALEHDRVLIAGIAGSGKTRLLRQIVLQRAENVTHVLMPNDALTTTQNKYRVEQLSFNGDVLLVWDDIHRIDAEQNNDAFESYVKAVEEKLFQEGNDLIVTTAARSGDISDLPGKGIYSIEDINNSTGGLWGDFNAIEVSVLSQAKLHELASEMASEYGLELPEQVRSELVQKASHASAPNYFDAVFDTLEEGATVTSNEIKELPDSAVGIWNRQYNKLSSSSDGRDLLDVLRACRLLHDIKLRYPAPLVWGIWAEVISDLKKGKSDFIGAIGRLLNKRWIDTSEDGQLFHHDLIYQLHDTQVEALDRSLEVYAEEFSAFIQHSMKDYLEPNNSELESLVNGQFAIWCERNHTSNVAEIHYRRALSLRASSEDLLDSDYLRIHFMYGRFLTEHDRWESGESHYKRIIESTTPDEPSPRPQTRTNLGLLYEEKGDLESAKEQYQANIKETSPSEDLVDFPRVKSIYNLADLKKKEGMPGFIELYEQVLDETSVDNAEETKFRAGVLLELGRYHDEQGEEKTAKQYYNQCLRETSPTEDIIDSDHEFAHINFAIGSSNLGEFDKAKQHAERAITLANEQGHDNSDIAGFYETYSGILEDSGQIRQAEEAIKKSLELTSSSDNIIDSPNPSYHYLYGLQNSHLGNSKIAQKHYIRAIDLTEVGDGFPRPQAHMNLGNEFLGEEEYKKAKEQYERLLQETSFSEDLEYDPQHKGLVNLGNAFIAMEEMEKAKNQYEKVLEVTDPSENYHGEPRINAMANLSWINQNSGNHEETRKLLESALSESSPTEDPIDSPRKDIHLFYVDVLEQLDMPEKAEDHRHMADKLPDDGSM